MTKDYKAIIGDITAYSKELHKLIPDTMAGFSSMAKATPKPKLLMKNQRDDCSCARRFCPL